MLTDAEIAARYVKIRPYLDERQRRLWLGVEAQALGSGGVAVIARATGADVKTVRRGTAEIESGAEPGGGGGGAGGGRARRGGGGAALRVPAALDDEVAPASGGGAGRPGPRGDGADRGQPAGRSRVQPAGQRQDHRGEAAPRPRRPVPVHQRPGHSVPGRRPHGDRRDPR